MFRGRINFLRPALDYRNVSAAVKVMKSQQPRQVPSDLLCRRSASTARHQSLLRPKEPQLTSDPSPLRPPP